MANRTTKVKLLVEAENYVAGMDKAAKSTREVGSEAEKLAQKKEAFNTLGASALAFGAVATTAIALVTKSAMDWESAWTGVLKTVDGTPAQLAAVEEGLRSMARELPASHTEIAAVAEAAGQLGIQTDSVVDFTRVMIDLGETTNLSADEAATALARFSNIMGTSQDEVSRLGSTIVALGNNYATTEAEIVAMSMRLAGAGKQAKLTEGDVFGLAAAMSSVGIDAEAGGTAMSITMKRIAKEVETAGPKLELFASTAGLTSAQFSQAWKKDAAGALALFIDGLGAAEASGKSTNAVLAELGVTGIRESDALLRLSSATGLLSEALDTGNEAFKENNALAAEAAQRYATVESKLAAAGGAINDAAIDLGSVLLPAVAAAAEGVAGLAGAFADMPDGVQGAIMIVAGLTAVVALGGGAFMLAVPKIATYRAALATMGATAQRTAGFVGSIGKAAAALGLAFAAVQLLSIMSDWSKGASGARQSADDFTKSLTDLDVKASDIAKSAFFSGGEFDPIGTKGAENLNLLVGEMSGLGNVMADLQGSFAGTLYEIATFGAGDTSLGDAKKNIEELDGALAGLVAGGNGDRAAEVWAELVAQTDGSEESLKKLTEMFPQYAAAASEAEGQSEDTGEAIMSVQDAADAAQKSISDMTDALLALKSPQLDAASAARAFEASIDDAATALQKQRDEYEKANDTLDGFVATLDIGTESGRENEAALDAIASAAAKSAAAILENGGSQDEAAAAIERGREALRVQLEQFGVTGDAAQVYIDKILATPDDISTLFTAETDAANKRLEEFVRNLNNIPGQRDVVINQVVKQTGAPQGMVGAAYNENGGMWNKGVRAFEDGGMASGIYAGRPGGIHKFAEESLPWEAYISPKPSMRERNLAIWAETGKRLGATAYENGGLPQYATNAPMSLSALSDSLRDGASNFNSSWTVNAGGLDPSELASLIDHRVQNTVENMLRRR